MQVSILNVLWPINRAPARRAIKAALRGMRAREVARWARDARPRAAFPTPQAALGHVVCTPLNG